MKWKRYKTLDQKGTIIMQNTKEQSEERIDNCTLRLIQRLTGGKWKPFIIWMLKYGATRFNVLYKELQPITHATLATQLKELERDGMITRTVYPEVPSRVEYELTQIGKEYLDLLCQIYDWAERNYVQPNK